MGRRYGFFSSAPATGSVSASAAAVVLVGRRERRRRATEPAAAAVDSVVSASSVFRRVACVRGVRRGPVSVRSGFTVKLREIFSASVRVRTSSIRYRYPRRRTR